MIGLDDVARTAGTLVMGGGLYKLVMWRLDARKSAAETRKVTAETSKVEADTELVEVEAEAKSVEIVTRVMEQLDKRLSGSEHREELLLERVDRVRADLEAERSHSRECDLKLAAANRRIDGLVGQIEHLKEQVAANARAIEQATEGEHP